LIKKQTKKKSVIIYSPSSQSKPVWLSSLELKRRYVGNQTVSVPIDFHCMGKKYNGNQWEPKLFGYQHSSKYLL